MSKFKKCKVVMLPTNEKAIPVGNIFINQPKGKWNKSKLHIEKCERVTQHGHSWSGNGIKTDIQHLYITSDDKIKEGDLVIGIDPISYGHIDTVKKGEKIGNCYEKIIATTDSFLTILKKFGEYSNDNHERNFPEQPIPSPQPSQSFIEKYIEEYNKGNIITDVLVEYEPVYLSILKEKILGYKLKINSKDNTITIKRVKDSWDKDEVIELCTKAFKAGDKFRLYLDKNALGIANKDIPSSDIILDTMGVDKWIEENL